MIDGCMATVLLSTLVSMHAYAAPCSLDVFIYRPLYVAQ
jgi:hypothetical protein